ncbi:CPBP family intramembrane glutamic endopeptidase [Pseudorhodoferax sp.]|uniref:CPBP family intramembrane glutamic endopeptidase n=1 Tax=Pseudorhodoferax sp. TaxID=1993553 RepID=UPI002DD6AB55|nr:CPBP family intramembrane glutamic endopeptidase [Pseudorhodoferax sp.]
MSLLAIAPFLLLAWRSRRWLLRATPEEAEALPSLRALAVQTLLLQVLVLGAAWLAARGAGHDIAWRGQWSPSMLLLAGSILGATLLFAWLEAHKPLAPHDRLRRRLRQARATDPLWLAATAVAAVVEESAYRGVLTALFTEFVGPLPAALVSAALFGLAHLGGEISAPVS